MLKVSIITVVKNAEKTIQRTIASVLSQSYKDIEFIVIDGLSSDATLNVVSQFQTQISLVLSEKDHGIYDAMNKGLLHASGDIIGILNADDFYAHHDVVHLVVKEFTDKSVDIVYGDVQYFSPKNINQGIRTYSSRNFSPKLIKFGMIPAHPTVFLRKSIYTKIGHFNPSFKIGGDFDLLARIFTQSTVSYAYLPQILVKMQYGGVSTSGLRSWLSINREIYRSCKENRIHTSYLHLLLRYPIKILEFLKR